MTVSNLTDEEETNKEEHSSMTRVIVLSTYHNKESNIGQWPTIMTIER